MAPFDGSVTISHWSAIVSIAPYCTISMLFDTDKCRDLQRSLVVIENDSI